jgi:signal transduction histidine kinase
MADTNDGRLWMGTREKGLFVVIDGRVSAVKNGLSIGKITCLLPLEDGKLWIGTDKGIVRWNGAQLTLDGIPAVLRHTRVLALVRDRDSNIWAGTPAGLLRINGDEVSPDEGPGRTSVTALFEDREGNIWVGGPQGLERLRDSAFLSYSVASLRSESSGPVYVDHDQRVWFAPFEGGLHWLKGEKSGSVTNDRLNRDVVYSIAGSNSELWIGRQRGGLTHLLYGGGSVTTKTYTQADGLAQNSVYAVHQGRDGTVWAATLSAGVSEYKNGHFVSYTTANGMSSNTVASISESPDGTMWFATPNGLNALSNGQWRIFTVREGMPSDSVNCLLSSAADVLWVGTASGLAFMRAHYIQVPSRAPASLHEPILDLAEDNNGWLWIATSNHVLRLKGDKLLGSTFTGEDIKEYGLEDGLLGTEGVKRYHSVFADPSDKIWFSMNRGLSVVDPARAIGSSPPAIVHIEGIEADGNPIGLQGPIRLPGPSRRITFGYAGLSLSVPERVRFKYKLEGVDEGWSDPVAAREATYNNLGAGRYRFRVLASNSDGAWNSSDSSILFTIAPVFWRTWWFELSSVLAVVLVILAYIRLRVLGLTRQLNVRFEERLAERTRIAQELHDTLLQGFLSASMQLHVADDRLPADSPAKPLVGRVLQLMGNVIEESRNVLQGLRSSRQTSQDLEQAFSQIRQEFPVRSQTGFRVIVEGAPRPLRPVIRDEVYLIGHEALLNAFRHSRASDVEVEIEYAASHLRVLIRDNGDGIDPQVLRSGRDRHWGLPGMKERTERIGGNLKVFSRADAGTEVELSVPGHTAFEVRPGGHPAGWFSRFYAGRGRNNKSRSGSEPVR